jgi:hypothetical protein
MISTFFIFFLNFLSRADPEESVADLFYIEPAIIAEYLLEACNPGTHLAQGNFGILVLLVLQRSGRICLAQLGPSPYPALGRREPPLQVIAYRWPR